MTLSRKRPVVGGLQGAENHVESRVAQRRHGFVRMTRAQSAEYVLTHFHRRIAGVFEQRTKRVG